jgi:uncharacterized protein (DUF433 family)
MSPDCEAASGAMIWFSRGYNMFMSRIISIDKQILGGTPCFAGTRVPIRSLFDHLKLGYTVDGFLEQFPTVQKEQVEALLEYAKHQMEDQANEQANELVGR